MHHRSPEPERLLRPFRCAGGGVGPIRRLTDPCRYRDRERTGRASSREGRGGKAPAPFVNSAEQPGANDRARVADRAVQREHGTAACVARTFEQQNDDVEGGVSKRASPCSRPTHTPKE